MSSLNFALITFSVCVIAIGDIAMKYAAQKITLAHGQTVTEFFQANIYPFAIIALAMLLYLFFYGRMGYGTSHHAFIRRLHVQCDGILIRSGSGSFDLFRSPAQILLSKPGTDPDCDLYVVERLMPAPACQCRI